MSLGHIRANLARLSLLNRVTLIPSYLNLL
jgi:hypothetical protein